MSSLLLRTGKTSHPVNIAKLAVIGGNIVHTVHREGCNPDPGSQDRGWWAYVIAWLVGLSTTQLPGTHHQCPGCASSGTGHGTARPSSACCAQQKRDNMPNIQISYIGGCYKHQSRNLLVNSCGHTHASHSAILVSQIPVEYLLL